MRCIGDGFAFLEGVRWHDGRLYVSDCYTGRVLSWAADAGWSQVCEVPQWPSGLGWDADGRLLVVSMRDARLLRVDADGDLAEVADLTAYGVGPANDMVVDAAGRAYVGYFGLPIDGSAGLAPTTLVRVDPDGSVAVAADGLVFPNGAALTPDGATLLVAETFVARITAFDVGVDGQLSGRRVWAQLAPATEVLDVARAVVEVGVLPDGICLDAEGMLWVADAKGRGVLRVAEGGDVVDRVDTGELAVFACALGGDDGRTLFMCAAPPIGTTDPLSTRHGVLLATEVAVPGLSR